MTQTKSATTTSLTGKWKPYPAYKDSGVEWLGEIPEHWEVGKIGAACTVKARLGWRGLKASEYVNKGYIFLSTPNIKDSEIDFENVNYITAERYFESPEIILKVGDVLIAKDGSTLGITTVVRHLPAPTTVNSSIAVIRPYKLLDSVFLYWFLSCNYIQGFIQRMKDGMGVPHLFQADLRKFVALNPSFEEQRTIATFLNRETARINALIAKKERLIELLQEKRAALISHAVTKGLDPTVPKKDSGVEWLGEIPAHWEVKRLKFCLDSIEQGWSPTCENRPAELDEWGVLKVGCVNGVKFNPDENKALPAETQPIPELEIKQGDVLISRANTRELLGNASVVTKVRPHLLLCDKLYRLKILPNTVNPIYLVAAMGSSIIRFQLERDATGASNSMQNISQGTILNLVIPLPDKSEQAIVDYLESETAKIDALISRIREGIEKLKEYSTALISAAVTGKIDVRETIEVYTKGF